MLDSTKEFVCNDGLSTTTTHHHKCIRNDGVCSPTGNGTDSGVVCRACDNGYSLLASGRSNTGSCVCNEGAASNKCLNSAGECITAGQS